MATKAIGFTVSITTNKKRADFIKGNLKRDEALALAMRLCTTSNKVEIDREYEKTDRYGDIDYDSKPYGVMKKVKRKTGYAYVLKTFDSYGWDSWTYDVTPDLKLRNRR